VDRGSDAVQVITINSLHLQAQRADDGLLAKWQVYPHNRRYIPLIARQFNIRGQEYQLAMQRLSKPLYQFDH
jgi:hypothetical protein